MVKIIAIVLVMIVINVFLIYSVFKAWERTNDKVNKYFLDRSSDFYVEKQESKKPENDTPKEKQVVVKKKKVYVYENKIDNSSYKDREFNKKYKKVKEHLDVDKRQVIADIMEKDFNVDISIEALAIKLNESFSFDVIYELSTLSSEDQENILRSSLDLNEERLLDEYIKSTNTKFNCIDFMSYVQTMAKENDPNYYIKTGSRKDDFSKISDEVVTVYDDKITEGIKIVHKDKMYDYSI